MSVATKLEPTTHLVNGTFVYFVTGPGIPFNFLGVHLPFRQEANLASSASIASVGGRRLIRRKDSRCALDFRRFDVREIRSLYTHHLAPASPLADVSGENGVIVDTTVMGARAPRGLLSAPW